MPNIKRRDQRPGSPIEPPIERTDDRSSPGSGEDKLRDEADLQPEDVENGDTAR